MIVYTRLLELKTDFPEIYKRVLETIIDYCKKENINPLYEPLERLVGGDVHIIRTFNDLTQMVKDFGNMPDICGRVGDHQEIVYITNNAGGPAYYVGLASFQAWIVKQDDDTKRNFLAKE